MYMGLMMLGKLKHMQMNYYLSLVLLRLRLLLKSWKGINCQVFIKLWKNLSKQEMKHYSLRSTNSLIYLECKRIVKAAQESITVPIYKRRLIKQTVVIIEDITVTKLHTQFYPPIIP
jgi:hypothetical protein